MLLFLPISPAVGRAGFLAAFYRAGLLGLELPGRRQASWPAAGRAREELCFPEEGVPFRSTNHQIP